MGNTQPLPEKNHFYAVKEHHADDYPVWTQDGFEIVKLNVDELFTSDLAKLKQVGQRVVDGLSKDNVLILRYSPEFQAHINNAQREAKEFLSQSQAQKKKFESEKVEEKRAFYSGYSLIHFDNRNNKRDQEWRDVFQIRLGEQDHIPWPSDSFKSTTTQLYESQWSICVRVIHAMALALELNPLDFFNLVGSSPGVESTPDPVKSINTNLSLFRYFDKNMSYQTPQKCMVHRDHGLLTLLPKTDVPGLELLHPGLQQWIPMEQFIEENDVLLYCGEALERVTNSKVVPATHRVVRLPQKERFSMPFEMKPNDEALLKNLVCPEKEPNPKTFDAVSKEMQWLRIMRMVDRADGIEPTADPVQPKDVAKEELPNFGQAQHDVQLPSISVK